MSQEEESFIQQLSRETFEMFKDTQPIKEKIEGLGFVTKEGYKPQYLINN